MIWYMRIRDFIRMSDQEMEEYIKRMGGIQRIAARVTGSIPPSRIRSGLDNTKYFGAISLMFLGINQISFDNKSLMKTKCGYDFCMVSPTASTKSGLSRVSLCFGEYSNDHPFYPTYIIDFDQVTGKIVGRSDLPF